MEHRKDNIDPRIAARFGRNRARLPAPLFSNENALDFKALRVHRRNNRLGRAQRNFMLPAPPPVQNRDPKFHKIRFPRALVASSTASSAVRLASSSTGFTSTISSDVM